jgi:preprotein translocase subunit SecY
VALSLVQGLFISIGLESMSAPAGGAMIVIHPGWSFRLMTMITLTSGTAFLMWLGEQMTERGIGNGISMIIFAGIVARMPAAVAQSFKVISSGNFNLVVILLALAMMAGVVAFIVFMETAYRRIPIQYAKRVVGRRMYGGQSSHLPLKINMANVIPPIFASSIMMFPATIGGFVKVDWVQRAASYVQWGSPAYMTMYVAMIVFFSFFYTAVTFNPNDIAENLKKNGGFVPGVRPGKKTAEFIDKVMVRLTVIGSIYLSAVCVLPTVLIKEWQVPFYFGGTALLIVVGVAIDTIAQIESHTVMRNYDGFLQDGRLSRR